MMLENLRNRFFSQRTKVQQISKSNTNLLFLNHIHTQNETALNIGNGKKFSYNKWMKRNWREMRKFFLYPIWCSLRDRWRRWSFTKNLVKIHVSINCKKHRRRKYFTTNAAPQMLIYFYSCFKLHSKIILQIYIHTYIHVDKYFIRKFQKFQFRKENFFLL